MDEVKRGNAKIVGLIIIVVLTTAGFFYWQSQSGRNVQTPNAEVSESTSDTESAKVLAQKNSTYSEFNQSEYEKALSEGKIVYLEFYANWCPICRAQEPDLIEGFNQLGRTDVAGFRVNFKDDQTDENEKVLAAKYKVLYQHHKIVLKNKDVVIDSSDTWDAKTLLSEFSKL